VTTASFTVRIDTSAIEDKIREMVEGVSVSGIGPDGDSEYEISDVEITENPDHPYTWDVGVRADRIQGKFVSNDDFQEVVVDELDDTIELDLEVE